MGLVSGAALALTCAARAAIVTLSMKGAARLKLSTRLIASALGAACGAALTRAIHAVGVTLTGGAQPPTTEPNLNA